ncbi:MAG: hypothetical protein ACJAT2_000359 [Bacteriovoracaceae bacterium]|jgi:hypothetical protein
MATLSSCKKAGNAGKSVFEPAIQGLNLTADAGIDQASSTSLINLNGSSSSAEGKSYSWVQTSGPGVITFGNSANEDTTATASLEGTYELTYTVSASSGDTASDSMIFIYDATSPIVDAGVDALLKNSAFTQAATVTDDNSVTYAWSLDSGPGNLSAADVEDPVISVDADGSYVVRLTATDVAGNQSFDTFTLDWDSSAPIVNAGVDKMVSVITLQDATVTDLNPVSYTWSKLSGPGVVSFGTPGNEDTDISASVDGDYVIRLSVTDSFGNNASDTINWRWDTTAPSVTEVTSSNADASYGSGSTLQFLVKFDEDVVVTSGTPQLTLELGATDFPANYLAGSGSSTLTFNYTVTGVDTSADLDYTSSSALSLNGAIIQDQIGYGANLLLAAPGAVGSISDNQQIVIDTTAPSITEVKTNQTDGTYGTSASMDILVVFDEVVNTIGTPQLTLETGVSDSPVSYSSGSGSDTLTFTYTVSAGDASTDLDYVSTSSLSLNGGSIRDAASNNSSLVLGTPGLVGSISDDKAIVIDTTAPVVSEVTANVVDATYGTTAVIPIHVIFSEPVIVAGAVQITLETGVVDQVVSYTSGSGTSTLTFEYTVALGDASLDLDYLNTASLDLNGGSIDDGVNAADLTLATPGLAGSISDNQSIIIDTSGPSISSVRSTATDGSYGVGTTIDILVEWSEVVNVTGIPKLTLETGATDASVSYFDGTGTGTLTFRYVVASGDINTDLDYTSTSALNLDGGTIQNGALQDALINLAAPGATNSISDNQDILVDGEDPTVSQVYTLKANGAYRSGEIIDVVVQFSEPVNISGAPSITLATGGANTDVSYTSGSGTSSITFSYTVGGTDTSTDLDYLSTSSLVLNAGTIRDTTLNDAVLTLAAPGGPNSISDDKAIVIDNTNPNLLSVDAISPDGGYSAGAPLSFRIVFDENVVIASGTPNLTLELGTTDRPAVYSGGSGTDSLTFNYTVTAGDVTADLDYANTFALDNGVIEDMAGNTASLTLPTPGALNSISDDRSIVIDTVAPTLNQVLTLKANGTYGIGEEIDILIEYNEPVIVTGVPRLTLETGVLDEQVSYTSGSGTNLLTFTYTVASGHLSSDLDYKNTSSLNLMGGTIRDLGTNSAPLVLPTPNAANSISDDKAIVIDGVAPTVTEVRSTKADGGYKALEVIDILVIFDEPVFVSGVPKLTLETGATDAVVNYSAGSTTDTLTFQYTVGAGQVNLDLDYASTTALSLGGGTIGDVVPNPADLTLPAPGGTNSISDNQNILIDSIPPVIDAGTDLYVNSATVQDATATDDSTLSYSWTRVSGPVSLVITNPTSQDPTLSALSEGVFGVQMQVTDQGGNVVTDTMSFTWDTTPPPALTTFSGVTTAGLNNAIIDVVVDFPLNVSDYEVVEIRGQQGSSAPTNCTSGTVLKTYNTGTGFVDDSYEQETNYPGGVFSARACISDKAGNLTSSQTYTNVSSSKQHKFFVSSALFTGDLKKDYLAVSFNDAHEGANARCKDLADTAGISTASDRWVAIIGTNLMNANKKIAVNGTINSMNSDVVATSKFDLWDSAMIQTNEFDENGTNVGGVKVWSGILGTGALDVNHCQSFTDETNLFQGMSGQADRGNEQWVQKGAQTCDSTFPIWCISQNSNIPEIDSLSITTGTGTKEIDISITLANDVGVERFYQKIEVYRRVGGVPPSFNCDGSDGSVLAQTFNAPFTQAQVINYTDTTVAAAGTNHSYTICTYDTDSNPALRKVKLSTTSGL